MIARFSLTPVELEYRLVRYYLHTDGVGGAGPLTYIDASRTVLQTAMDAPDEAAAIAALVDGCGELRTADFLENGWTARWPREDCPGWFRFLVLTCAVVAEADRNPVSQDFGQNLNIMFGTHNRFMNRTALPRMWHALVNWSKVRRSYGDHIRLVELPPPGVGVHIGITNAVSFPSWRDIARIRHWLESSGSHLSEISTPAGAARTLCQEILNGPSAGNKDQLRRAADEYYELYLSRSSLLRLHRFWGAIQRACGRVNSAATAQGSVRAELRHGFQAADTSFVFTYESDERFDEWRSENGLKCGIDDVVSHLERWPCPAKLSVRNLCDRFNRGAVAFCEERFGTWVAARSGIANQGRWIFVCRTAMVQGVGKAAAVTILPITRSWSLVGPIEGGSAVAVARALGVNDTRPSIDVEQAIRLDQGIRTQVGWLGRVSVLPFVHKSSPGAVDIAPSIDGQTEIQLGSFVNDWSPLQAQKSVNGAYRLRLEESIRSGACLAIEKTVNFVSDAPEHSKLSSPTNDWEILRDCRDDAWEVAPNIVLQRGDQFDGVSTTTSVFDDFLEVVYARGRSGWQEADLVELIRYLLPGPSPWDVLQALKESNWLEKTVSTRVKATRWWLLTPHIVTIGRDGPIVLRGSAPAKVRQRFARTAENLGGSFHTVNGQDLLSPPIVYALGVDPERLSQELEMSCAPAMVGTRMPAPKCWLSSDMDPSQHRLHQIWSVDVGNFVQIDRLNPPTGVNLTRWIRDDRIRSDLYLIESPRTPRRITPNRLVAIAEFYRLVCASMFSLTGNLLARLPNDGYLPLHLARRLCLTTLCGSGPIRIGGRWTYVYPASKDCLKIINSSLGSRFVVGAIGVESGMSEMIAFSESIGIKRHRVRSPRMGWGIY